MSCGFKFMKCLKFYNWFYSSDYWKSGAQWRHYWIGGGKHGRERKALWAEVQCREVANGNYVKEEINFVQYSYLCAQLGEKNGKNRWGKKEKLETRIEIVNQITIMLIYKNLNTWIEVLYVHEVFKWRLGIWWLQDLHNSLMLKKNTRHKIWDMECGNTE